ncbi:MAG: Hsp70 family protein [Gemmataceae bacterium]
MNPIIGIDLGTTNSACGYLTEAGPDLVPNALGERLTPSIVGIDGESKLVVGRAAKELQVLEPERCVGLFKRKMGQEEKIEVGGRSFSPTELSSLVLRSLKEDAEAFFKGPVERAVITVPAYFNDQQRKATIHAGQIAGLKVERILNEPTAAALAYGFHEAGTDQVLLVFDLGGGTFDVSLVEVFAGVLEVKASCGEVFLGGEDFTRALAARILQRRGQMFERAELEAPRLVSRLIQLCEKAKCKLSAQETAGVRVPNAKGELGPQAPEELISRAELQAWTQNILARVETPIRRVLGDARLTHDKVDEVLLVGGATRMPMVTALVQRLFGKKPQCRLHPDEVVALGAAVQAGLIGKDRRVEEMVVTDVAPFTLGMEVSKQFGTEKRHGYFLPIIHRNTTIPVSRVEVVATMAPNQPDVMVKIYQGESRRVEDNLFLGEFMVAGIPAGPAGQPVEVRFTYDLNGVLEVEATVLATQKKFSHLITRHAKGMTREQIVRAVKDMAKLKTHPREETANRYLLRRAERVYQELTAEQRDFLSQMLDAFEAALSRRDPSEIENTRTLLDRFLRQMEPEGEDYPWKTDEDDD